MGVNAPAVSDVACAGDCNSTVSGVSTGRVRSGEDPVEPIPERPPDIYGEIQRRGSAGDIVYNRNARANVEGFEIVVELGVVAVQVEESREARAPVAGISTGKLKFGLARIAAEDNVTDEELLLILAAA
jgi:hypothetical protein